MASITTYLITGANRGIGLGLTSSLLLRPNTTVIATIRSSETPTEGLLSLSKASGSILIIIPLSYEVLTSEFDTAAFLTTLRSHGIDKINNIIANAGTSSFAPLLQTTLSAVHSNFETNTLFPLLLFQTLHSFLSSPSKFILISSVLGSLAVGPSEGHTLAYGMSKAAANYLIRKIHFELPDVVALAIHPGWVKTENGTKYAESLAPLGFEGEPPLGVEGSVEGVLSQIDTAEKTTTSGSFVGWDGKAIPW